MNACRRVALFAAALGACTSLLAGCGRNDSAAADEVRAAVDRALQNAHGLAYLDTTSDNRTAVDAVIDDGYRYKARVSIDNNAVLEEVVVDDALAVRVLDPSQLGRFLRPGPRALATAEQLRTRRWITDDEAAPDLAVSDERRVTGADPVLDAIEAFDYVLRAVDEARSVFRYNKDALDYQVEEDPFPGPRDGERRYDLEPTRLPAANPSSQLEGGLVLPSNLRRLAVYVRDGGVVRVRERISVVDHLDRLADRYDVAKRGSRERLVVRVLDAVNRQRRATGLEAIRAREMSLKVVAFRSPSITLPTDAVEGDLSVLVGRGRRRIG